MYSKTCQNESQILMTKWNKNKKRITIKGSYLIYPLFFTVHLFPDTGSPSKNPTTLIQTPYLIFSPNSVSRAICSTNGLHHDYTTSMTTHFLWLTIPLGISNILKNLSSKKNLSASGKNFTYIMSSRSSWQSI